jgi:phenylalanyl-tRNA synthetase beta chain
MLFLKSWLEEYINLTDYSDQELMDLISTKSGECESVEVIQDYFGGKVLVGKIENLRKHPEADRLNIFDVNLGEYKVQIVSAAPNARNGLICPVAINEAKLPYMTIAFRKMRGIESQGMCCGKSELALETEFSSGLWELNESVSDKDLGLSICEVLPEYFPAQVRFEIKYLQDKLSSCASHLGLSIEIARCLQKPELLKNLAKKIWNGEDFWTDTISKIEPSSRQIKLTDKTNKNNIYNLFEVELEKEYTLNHVWQTRLFLTEKNLTGGLIDLSNYLLFDFGQPNHFFAGDKINSNNWSFEHLEAEQKFSGLGNLKNVTLPKGTTVLRDEEQILIVPGISGSTQTKIETNSLKVLVEITNFDMETIARNAFAINYRSDSAKFFASGVNKGLQLIFLVKLIELSGIKITHNLLWNKSVYFDNIESWFDNFKNNNKIKLDLDYIVSRLDNRDVSFWRSIILQKLNFIGKIETNGDGIFLLIDNYYSKLETNEDVLFELLKLVGFESLQEEYLTFSAKSKTPSYNNTINLLKNHFVNFGFREVLTRPFLPHNRLFSTLTNQPQVALEALSSQRADEPFLRDSLFSSLMKIANLNIQLGLKEINIFELTRIYTHQSSQPDNFSLPIDTGNTYEKWSLSTISTSQDPYLLTSVINLLFDKISTEPKIKQEITPLGNSTVYSSESLKITLTEVNNSFKKLFEIPITKKIWYTEVSFLPKNLKINQYNKFQDQSQFPSIKRSISWKIDTNIKWNDILNKLQKIEFDGVVDISSNERFEMDTEFEAINFNLKFTSFEKTLTSQTVELYLSKAILECSSLGFIEEK